MYVDGEGGSRRLSPTYGLLQAGLAARGGSMFYVRQGYRWGAWVARIGVRQAVFPAEGNQSFKLLDQLHVPKPGITYPSHWYDYLHQLVPGAIDKLVSMLK
jgi:hypothetical protein